MELVKKGTSIFVQVTQFIYEKSYCVDTYKIIVTPHFIYIEQEILTVINISGLKNPSLRRIGGSTGWKFGLSRGKCGLSNECPIRKAAEANSVTIAGLQVGEYSL